MKSVNIYSLLIFVSLTSWSQVSVDKPTIFQFGSSMSEMKAKLMPYCESFEERLNEPIQLPTAKNSQSQLDCMGYMYAGKKRKVELVFADDVLDMIWILTEAEEEDFFIQEFTKLYGAPTHMKEDVTFFLNDNTAVRNQPHEVLFISDRLREPYGAWLNSPN